MKRQSATPWNVEYQTDERKDIRCWVASHFREVIGEGKHTIFSLTSAEANCVKVFEQPEFSLNASSFVTTEHNLAVFKNIEHPRVTKHYGSVKRFVKEQSSNYDIDAAWLDYTNYLSHHLDEIAEFAGAFFTTDSPHVLALTFLAESMDSVNEYKKVIECLSERLDRKFEIEYVASRLEEKKAKRKPVMAFLILKFRYTHPHLVG